MKKVLSLCCAVAMVGALFAGCASQDTVKQLQANQDQIVQRLNALEQKQSVNAQACQDAANRAEAAANRAESMANKCESIFMKHMKK